MIHRRLAPILQQRLADTPAVVLLGPRQSGKTTLALEIAEQEHALYLDLESPGDRAKLGEPELYLGRQGNRLMILDEVQQVPGLFPILRGQIDRARRVGRKSGMFLLLGSAGLDLLQQSGETLAGRVSFMELGPFDALEAGGLPLEDLWLRGGFPNSVLAPDEDRSLRWRMDFIRTYLERDIPRLGPRIPAETLQRFWTMLAHNQGGLLNSAQLARNLGEDVRTVNGYLDLLVDLLLVRRLQPWHSNAGKRLVKSPKVYLRDSGLVHALLRIPDREALLSHPVVGQSWEGFALENLVAAAGDRAVPYFYRTSAGAEIDLVLAWPDGSLWVVEIKRSLTPRPERGFHSACADLEPRRRFVVYPGEERYPLAEDVEAVPLRALMAELLG